MHRCIQGRFMHEVKYTVIQKYRNCHYKHIIPMLGSVRLSWGLAEGLVSSIYFSLTHRMCLCVAH